MKTHSKRFTEAVTKLYTAFHEGSLNYGDCDKCAVGSIVGNNNWFLTTPIRIFDGEENYESSYFRDNNSGYSQIELANVERIFVLAFKDSKNPYNKESQFKGLCAVVEYLCELEGIPNIMDYTALFETENDAPKHQLEEVFV